MPAAAHNTTSTTALAARLARAGVPTTAIEVLGRYYPNAHPTAFLKGLESVTRALLTLSEARAIPAQEPWAALAAALAGTPPGDLNDCFQAALSVYSPELQLAVDEAVQGRMLALQAEEAAKQVGAAARRRRPTSAEYLKALADNGYTFRQNALNDLVEVNGEPIGDGLAAQIRVQMRDLGFQYMAAVEDCYLAEARRNQFNPIIDYLDGVPYDGGPHIERLAAHFQDQDGIFPLWLKRWLVGAVAKVRSQEQNAMLVFDGKQDLGKSTFVQWLGSGLPGYCIESAINLDDKDCHIRLCSTFIWEVSEFGSTMRRQDREALKGFLTQKTVRVRRPYSRFDMERPATASFLGTINNESGILSDPTGSRRFLICNLTAIDWGYRQAVDPNQVWAEANALYLSGEPWQLEPAERVQREQINERYEVEDPIEGLLKKFFILRPANPQAWTSTVDILTRLEEYGLRGGNTRAHSMALACVATRLGLVKRKGYTANGQRVWGYEGVERI